MHASMNINASNHECTVLRASTSLIVGPPTILGRLWVLLPQIVQKPQKCLVGRDEITVLFLGCPSMAPQLALGPCLRRAAGQAPACRHFGHHSAPPPFLLFSSILFLKGAFCLVMTCLLLSWVSFEVNYTR